jgi:hypothetical protein
MSIGNDIMDVVPSPEIPHKQTFTLFDANEINSNFVGQTFALQYTFQSNQTFATKPILWDADNDVFATLTESALMELPFRAVDDVNVNVDQHSAGSACVIIHLMKGRMLCVRMLRRSEDLMFPGVIHWTW